MNSKKMLFVVTVFIVSAYSVLSAMERIYNEFVDLPFKEMRDYTGVADFYKEYKAHEELKTGEEPIISFPIKCCDPLPIHSFKNVRWFATSAVGGKVERRGRNIEIIDPFITNILAVRGKNYLENIRSEIYFGYDCNNPKFNNVKKKVFQGIFLYAMNKDLHSIENVNNHTIPNEARDLSARLVQTSTGQYFFDIKEVGAKKPVLVPIDKDFFNELYHGPFECYWTVIENKLKGIEYLNNKK